MEIYFLYFNHGLGIVSRHFLFIATWIYFIADWFSRHSPMWTADVPPAVKSAASLLCSISNLQHFKSGNKIYWVEHKKVFIVRNGSFWSFESECLNDEIRKLIQKKHQTAGVTSLNSNDFLKLQSKIQTHIDFQCLMLSRTDGWKWQEDEVRMQTLPL